MKVSEITVFEAARHMKLEQGEYDPAEVEIYLDAAKEYVADYVGIPQFAENGEESLDDHAKFSIAVLVLCQEFYDNRTVYASKNKVNEVLKTILFMHRKNLV